MRTVRLMRLAPLAVALSLSACNSRTSDSASEAATPAARSVATSAHRIALVIGNDTYQHVTPLRNARADARAVKSALKSVGFDVTLKEDVDLQELKSALRTFKSKIAGGDDAVFYFSGHGVQFEGTNYLIPTDLMAQSPEQVMDDAVPLQRVLDDMREVKARFALAIVDACRDNPFKGTGRAIGGRGLAPVTAANGQMVMYSAGAGQEALDRLGPQDSDPNGVFTRVLIREISKPGVPADQVLKNVKARVVTLAAEVHHEQVPALYDQSIGEFYFVAPPPPLPPPAPPVPIPQPETARGPTPEELEVSFWNRIKDSRDLADFKDYTKQFANGAHAAEAALMIRKLERKPAPSPPPTPVNQTNPPQQSAPGRARNGPANGEGGSAAVLAGTFEGYVTTSMSPGARLRGRLVLKSNGDFEYRGTNGVTVSGNMDLTRPSKITGKGMVTQPKVLGIQLRYPDGSTHTDMTLRAKIESGKLQGEFTDRYEKGELVFDRSNP